jgi:hypothetical protein
LEVNSPLELTKEPDRGRDHVVDGICPVVEGSFVRYAVPEKVVHRGIGSGAPDVPRGQLIPDEPNGQPQF